MRPALALLVSLLIAGSVAAQSPAERPGQARRSLDEQLLDDLDQELLHGLSGGNKQAGESGMPRATHPPGGQQPGQAAANAAAQSAAHPLGKIADEMRQVERRMSLRDTSPATQQQQASIVAQLEALLQQAQQAPPDGQKKAGAGAAQAGAGTGDPLPTPPRDSSNRLERGTKEQTETADVKDTIRRLWGHLPDKQREEMQASLSEKFLPKYERLIEEYYKRLAEERP